MVCILSFGEISNIHDGLHIRLASAFLTESNVCARVSVSLSYVCVCVRVVLCTCVSARGGQSVCAVHLGQ